MALSALKDLVWSIHPENDTLASLGEFIADCSSRFLTAAGLKFDLDVPLDLPARTLSGELRGEVAALFKEALRNVVQHANARNVQVCPRIDENELTLIVRDGQTAADGNGRFSIDDFSYDAFHPAMNEAGQMVFEAKLSGTTGGNATMTVSSSLTTRWACSKSPAKEIHSGAAPLTVSILRSPLCRLLPN